MCKKRIIVFSIVAVVVIATGVTWYVARGGEARDAASVETVHVAVASNFADAITEIARRFERQSGRKVVLSFGSTGKHYAQIKNGAPFDLFLSADAQRPKLLETDGAGVAGTRFTYAIGRVVLWSPAGGLVDGAGAVLRSGGFDHLAIANPRLAPYGAASQQVLEALGLWDELQSRIVRGENIGQTLQFVRSGSAELGFVALSQITRPGRTPRGSYWEPPQSLYTPIEQQAVLLKDSAPARAFVDYLRGDEAAKIIRGYGYRLP